jgi:hypothetical protein
VPSGQASKKEGGGIEKILRDEKNTNTQNDPLYWPEKNKTLAGPYSAQEEGRQKDHRLTPS